jgi:type I restriction enzyme R subunit
MRDVRSKNYYEQMLGRATRTLDYENLSRVSPSAKERKLGYIIVDAVGVTKTQKTTSRQLERKPTVSFKDLMMSVAMGARDEDTLTSLASRLIKLDKIMNDKEKAGFKEICDEKCIDIAQNLLNAFDEDYIETSEKTSEELADIAAAPFNNPKLRDYIENVRKNHDQVIDNINMDEVTFAGWNEEQAEKSMETINLFAQFIENNKNDIEALEIIYSQSYRTRPLTLRMIQELYEVLQKQPYRLTTEKLWAAYSIQCPEKVRNKSVVNKLADIISLIRFQLEHINELRPFADEVNLRFRDWILSKNAGNVHFTEEQTEWLRMIRDHIAASISITPDDLDYMPFDSKGGLGKFYQLFGSEYETLLNEINDALLKVA